MPYLQGGALSSDQKQVLESWFLKETSIQEADFLPLGVLPFEQECRGVGRRSAPSIVMSRILSDGITIICQAFVKIFIGEILMPTQSVCIREVWVDL